MVNDQITAFTETNENLYFLRFNLLNDYYMAVSESAELYTEDLVNLTSSVKSFFYSIRELCSADFPDFLCRILIFGAHLHHTNI